MNATLNPADLAGLSQNVKQQFDSTASKFKDAFIRHTAPIVSAFERAEVARRLDEAMTKAIQALLFAVRFIFASIKNLLGIKTRERSPEDAIPTQAFAGDGDALDAVDAPASVNPLVGGDPSEWERVAPGSGMVPVSEGFGQDMTLDGDFISEKRATPLLGKPLYLLPHDAAEAEAVAETAALALLRSAEAQLQSSKVMQMLVELTNGHASPDQVANALVVPVFFEARQSMKEIEDSLFKDLDEVLRPHVEDTTLRHAAIREVIAGLPAVNIHSTLRPEAIDLVLVSLRKRSSEISSLLVTRAQVNAAPSGVSDVRETMSPDDLQSEFPDQPTMKRSFQFPGSSTRGNADAEDVGYRDVQPGGPRSKG